MQYFSWNILEKLPIFSEKAGFSGHETAKKVIVSITYRASCRVNVAESCFTKPGPFLEIVSFRGIDHLEEFFFREEASATGSTSGLPQKPAAVLDASREGSADFRKDFADQNAERGAFRNRNAPTDADKWRKRK